MKKFKLQHELARFFRISGDFSRILNSVFHALFVFALPLLFSVGLSAQAEKSLPTDESITIPPTKSYLMTPEELEFHNSTVERIFEEDLSARALDNGESLPSMVTWNEEKETPPAQVSFSKKTRKETEKTPDTVEISEWIDSFGLPTSILRLSFGKEDSQSEDSIFLPGSWSLSIIRNASQTFFFHRNSKLSSLPGQRQGRGKDIGMTVPFLPISRFEQGCVSENSHPLSVHEKGNCAYYGSKSRLTGWVALGTNAIYLHEWHNDSSDSVDAFPDEIDRGRVGKGEHSLLSLLSKSRLGDSGEIPLSETPTKKVDLSAGLPPCGLPTEWGASVDIPGDSEKFPEKQIEKYSIPKKISLWLQNPPELHSTNYSMRCESYPLKSTIMKSVKDWKSSCSPAKMTYLLPQSSNS